MKKIRPSLLYIFVALIALTATLRAKTKPAAIRAAASSPSVVFQRGYVDEQYGYGGSLYMLDPTTTDPEYFFGGGNHPNYSSDGSAIVFVDTDGNLATTPANNYTPTNLVIAGGGSILGGLKPKWSPDATLIAFATEATNANKIAITNATCTSGNEYNAAVCNYTKLDEASTSVDLDPDWYPGFASNDTARIGSLIYVRKANSNATTNDIYSTDVSIDANGVVHEIDTTNLTQSVSTYEAPRYSHDGSKIIFVQGGTLHLMDSDGTNQHPIVASTDSGLIYGYDPAFSADDTKIIWGSGAIYSADLVINQNGSVSANNIKEWTNGSNDRSPSWVGPSSPAPTPTPVPNPTQPPHGGLSATAFTVNETNSVAANLNDTVLRFRAVQLGTPAGLLVRVQANYGNGWDYLADGLQGRMAYAPQVTGYILNSTNYPTASSVSFRAVSTAPGYPDSISNEVGPFNLTQNRPHLGPTVFLVSTNGEVNAIRFGVNESSALSGTFVRVQSTQTPAQEDSWSDVTINNTVLMTQDPNDLHQFYSGTNNYPDSDGIYFRAVASNSNGSGYVNSISIPYGPFKFVSDPPASVTIKLNGETIAPNDIDSGQLIPAGNFNVEAVATSGRMIKRLALLLDGSLIKDFGDGTTDGAVDFNTRIAGDHLVEAYATDDLGVTGAAAPIHIRILPGSPGRVFMMQQSGDWNQPSNWIDIEGNSGVPGPNDFAIVSTFSPNLTSDVTTGAMSLNGGTFSGAHTLTVNSFCTIADGTIKSNFAIPAGATCELLNDTDITLTGTFTYAGTLRMHGKGGIGGVNSTSHLTFAGPHPDGVFDFVGGIIHGVGQFFVDLAAGGKRGSKATPAPTPAPLAPEKRAIKAAKVEIPAGKVTVVESPAVAAGLVAAGGGNLVAAGGGNLVAAGGGNLVAAGGGNLVAAGGGNLVAAGGGNLVAAGGGNLIATGGGNLIGQDGAGLVAAGGGNLVAAGGGNSPTHLNLTSAVDDAPITLSGGELDLNDLTVYGSVAMTSGILSGSGMIVGDLTNDRGFISPGHSAGVINVLGSFSQGANGTLIVENGGGSPTDYDQLSVSGSANLGGQLMVKLINGYTPDPADTFNPLGYTSATGNFASVSGNAHATLQDTGMLVTTNSAVPSPVLGQPRNISTRAQVLTGDSVEIGGFIIGGSAPKTVVLRAIGPSLANHGVAGALADPTLELFDGQQRIASNDNWRIDDATGQSQEASVPAELQPQSDRESVIVRTLQPDHLYTAIVRGKNNTTGVALVEAYDTQLSDTSLFSNISTRGVVGTDDNVMIGGFIIAETGPSKVIVRAIGPSLTSYGVPNVLQDPIVQIFDVNGNLILSNDDWEATQASDLRAYGRAPADPRESALIATLSPGNYTAVVRGKDNTTGVALVEVYNIQ